MKYSYGNGNLDTTGFTVPNAIDIDIGVQKKPSLFSQPTAAASTATASTATNTNATASTATNTNASGTPVTSTPSASETPVFASRTSVNRAEMKTKRETENGFIELGREQSKRDRESTMSFARNLFTTKNTMTSKQFSEIVEALDTNISHKDLTFLLLKMQELMIERDDHQKTITLFTNEKEKMTSEIREVKNYTEDLKADLKENTVELTETEKEWTDKNKILTIQINNLNKEKTDWVNRKKEYEKIIWITLSITLIVVLYIVNIIMNFFR